MAATAQAGVPVLRLVLLIATAIFLNYVDRGAIAVAAPLMMRELGLSATAFGIAVSAFFWIYSPIQLAIGWLCDRFSVYRLLAGGLALWALSTVATGWVSSLTGLVVLRLMLGIGESIAFPGASKVIARHVPASRRAIANASHNAALALGPAAGTLAGGLIMASFGWRSMFVVFGTVTLLWLLPWSQVTRRLPLDDRDKASERFPLLRLIGRRALWATSVGHFATNYGLYFLISWLPLYLVQQRGLSLVSMTMLATAAYLSHAASALIGGWLCDRFVAAGKDAGRVCRLSIVCGMGLLGLAITGIAFAGSMPLLIAFMLLAGIGNGASGPHLFTISQIFAGPRAAGTYVGVQNAIGNLAGIIGPVVTGIIVDRTHSFFAAFQLAAAICLLGALCWAVAVPRIVPLELGPTRLGRSLANEETPS